MSDWIEHILDLNMEDDEIIDYKKIKKIWNDFKNGNNSHTYQIWDILMLRSWPRS